jgi:membrane-associated phospholipid phosphatase
MPTLHPGLRMRPALLAFALSFCPAAAHSDSPERSASASLRKPFVSLSLRDENSLPSLGSSSPARPRRHALATKQEWLSYAGGILLLTATDRTTLSWFDADRFEREAEEGRLPVEGNDLASGVPLLVGLAVPYLVGGRHGRHSAKRALGAAVNAMVVVVPLKWLVGRERPEQSHGDLVLHGPSTGYTSFPSAHSAAAFAIATVYSRQYPRWKIPIYLLATGIGLARIETGRHHLSDVFAGAGIGILAGRATLRGRGLLLSWRL